MSAKYCLPVPVFHFLPKLTHPAARSVRDSWATCYLFSGESFRNEPLFSYVIFYHYYRITLITVEAGGGAAVVDKNMYVCRLR